MLEWRLYHPYTLACVLSRTVHGAFNILQSGPYRPVSLKSFLRTSPVSSLHRLESAPNTLYAAPSGAEWAIQRYKVKYEMCLALLSPRL